MAISGDAGWLLANAPFDDDTGLNAGAVKVFRRDGDTWVRDTRLISCQTDDDGTGVAIGADGVTIAIGADQEEVLGFTSGAAYLYETANLCPDCDDNGFLDHCDLEYGTHQDFPRRSRGLLPRRSPANVCVQVAKFLRSITSMVTLDARRGHRGRPIGPRLLSYPS